jgi:hypothetical protein
MRATAVSLHSTSRLHEKPLRQIGLFFAFITKTYGARFGFGFGTELNMWHGIHICQKAAKRFVFFRFPRNKIDIFFGKTKSKTSESMIF